MGPEVGPAFQRRSRDTPSSNLDVRFGGNGVQARGFKRNACFFGILVVDSHKIRVFGSFRTFRIFVTCGSKGPGNSGLRAAIRTAAHARSGRANDMDGIRE
eukprot:gene10471-biopygen7767